MEMNMRHSPLGWDSQDEVFVYNEIPISLDEFVLTSVIDDVSSASIHWTVSPYAGTIEKVFSVIDTALATNGAAAISFKIGTTAASDVTNGGITIALSSAAGAVDSSTPTAENTVAAGQAIALISDGGSTNASKAEVVFKLKRA